MADISDMLTDFVNEVSDKNNKTNKVQRMTNLEQIEVLQKFQESHAAGCKFKVGSLVTPRKRSFYKQRGEPHVVLEVLKPEDIHRLWRSDPSGPNYGAKTDMRIACLVRSGSEHAVLPYMVESWQFEEWTPENSPEKNEKKTDTSTKTATAKN